MRSLGLWTDTSYACTFKWWFLKSWFWYNSKSTSSFWTPFGEKLRWSEFFRRQQSKLYGKHFLKFLSSAVWTANWNQVLYNKVSRIAKFQRRGRILGKIIQFEPFRSIKTPFFGREPVRQKLGIFCKILFWVLNDPKTLPVTSWWKIDLKKCLFDPFWPTLIFT